MKVLLSVDLKIFEGELALAPFLVEGVFEEAEVGNQGVEGGGGSHGTGEKSTNIMHGI
jgi:hypothetical protein